MPSPRPACSNRPACSLPSTPNSGSCSFLPAARSCSPILSASSATFPTRWLRSFRATLEEVERAEILLHVQDAASPMREEQKTQVEKVLAELAVSTKPVIQVLNKVDLVPPQELAHLSSDREAIPVSRFSTPALNNS